MSHISKHNNKYWIREKEFRSLLREINFIIDSKLYRYYSDRKTNSKVVELESIIYTKYNMYFGKLYTTIPKPIRRGIHKSIRSRSKNEIKKYITDGKDILINNIDYKKDNSKYKWW